jgi:dinuclear metal center YbgI/SA1388 family protein
MIFSPIKKITFNSYLGSLIQKAIKHDITVYVAHTNFDISNLGMNKILADMLHIKDQKIIEYTTETEGLGIYGNIEETKSDEFIQVLKNTFELEKLSIIGLLPNKINTVAICGGSGSSLLKNPKLSNVDVYITGDVTYHHALDAKNAGITVVDVGHNIEKFGLVGLKTFLNSKLSLPIEITKVNTNPYIIK